LLYVFGLTFRRRPFPTTTVVWSLAIALGLAAGAIVAINPLVGVALAGTSFVLVGFLALGRQSSRVFLWSLAVLLVTYAFLGRGGAYIGIAPLYAGEVALSVGAVALLLNINTVRPGVIHVLLILFMVWGLVRTLPYIGPYGLDALRDAVTWAYGLFALAVGAMIRPRDYETIVRWYRRLIPWYLPAVPLVALGTRAFEAYIPKWPNTPEGGVGIVFFNAGHTGVHLAGVGAFILLGLYGLRRTRIPEAALWLFWMLGVGIIGSLNRGSLLAASTCGLGVAFLRSRSRWLSLAILAPTILALTAALNPVIDLGGLRKVSFDQLIQNVVSIFGKSSEVDLENTAEWRLAWWGKIGDYTIHGPYFWDGKGYGINLADDDGFQVAADGSLRAPHNGHIEILARSGVPGLALWVLVQGAYAVGLLRAALGAYRAGEDFWARVLAWLFIYWLAAMINMSFDPYLQGPHGGIWFWSSFGLGLGAMRAWRTKEGQESGREAMKPPGPAVAGQAGALAGWPG
jgi:O-antigen ligase/polysaccharide polymerase Wzy-like membrane protein